MNDAQRAASATNTGELIWTGLSVTEEVPDVPMTNGTNSGFMEMFAPSTYSPGSSVSHWSTAASPNLLMEPNINSDLTTDIDLTRELLEDIGWQFLPEGAPEITVSPLSLAFGNQNIDTGASAAQSVTITNDGNAVLSISSVSLSGTNASDFSISSDTGETTLDPLESRVVQVVFDPATLGSKSASLDVASDDADEGNVNVTLSGSGYDPDVGVCSPVFVDFAFAGVELGTSPNPFNTVAEGVAFVTVAGTVNFDAGSTTETGTFSKAMSWASTGGLVRIGSL
jgi:hypothetical protein